MEKNYKFEIEKKIETILTLDNGWTFELNIVSWNGKQGKIDVRKWNKDHSTAGKGMTFTDEEARGLYRALSKMYEK